MDDCEILLQETKDTALFTPADSMAQSLAILK